MFLVQFNAQTLCVPQLEHLSSGRSLSKCFCQRLFAEEERSSASRLPAIEYNGPLNQLVESKLFESRFLVRFCAEELSLQSPISIALIELNRIGCS